MRKFSASPSPTGETTFYKGQESRLAARLNVYSGLISLKWVAKIVNLHNELTVFFNEGVIAIAVDYPQRFVIACDSKRWELTAEIFLKIMEAQEIELPFGITH